MRNFFFLMGILMLFSCHQKVPDKVVKPSFYAWKTVFAPGSWEVQTLRQWQCKRLYLKIADIDIDPKNGIYPRSFTKINWDSLPGNIEIVPVFFIVNRVFIQGTASEIDSLNERLVQRLRQIIPADRLVPEIQIDCDWTAGTRDAYFRFLMQLKKRVALPISATIRLHQVKYRQKTGVPPVDRGLLMLYNFEQPSNEQVKNSIIDPAIAKNYLPAGTPPYPLPLDAALPLFRWGLHFRDQGFQGFLRDFSNEQADNALFLTRIEQNIYRVNRDTNALSTYFRRGDWIRTEAADIRDMQTVWQLAQPILPNDSCHLVFFDLSNQNLQYYKYEDLFKICRTH